MFPHLMTILKLALLLCLGNTIKCQIILAPSKLYVGEVNKLILISNQDSKAELSASFVKSFEETLFKKEIFFKNDVLVEYPLIIENPHKQTLIFLKVKFNTHSTVIEEFELIPANGFVFFQIDKPIYNVKETVKFRILRLDRSLSPIADRCTLIIKNNKNIKVEETELEIKPPHYIIEYFFNFPLLALPGVWKAELLYGPNFSINRTISFKTIEYILPLFKIDIITPRFHIVSSEINVLLNVTFNYGKPVQGMGYMSFKIKENKENYLFSTKTFCIKDGIYNYTTMIHPNFHINYGNSPRLVVEATVTDSATGIRDKNSNDNTILVDFPYRISLRNTILEYRPNVATYITFEVVDPKGKGVAHVPINISLTGEKGRNVLFDTISRSLHNEITTDENGQIVFYFKLDKSIGPITAKIQTNDKKFKKSEQTTKSFVISPFDIKENSFVSILNKIRITYSAGEYFRSSIVTHENVDKERIYLFVLSKGSIIQNNSLSSLEINLLLNNKMTPKIRLLVIAFLKNQNNFVSDSIQLFIEQKNCGVKVDLDANKIIYPGKNITFSMRGNIGDLVGLHSVDEAVYVLNKIKDQSSLQYKQHLELSDLGCGPGGGQDSFDVAFKAGLKVISANRKRKSNFLCKTKSRVKRSSSLNKNNKKYLYRCCELAMMKYELRMSCNQKKAIILKHTDKLCADKFYECCSNSTKRMFQGSMRIASSVVHDIEPNFKSTKLNKQEFVSDDNTDNLEMIRSDFCDTWLFDIILMNNSVESFTRNMPHSITSWIISSMSVSKKDGVCFNTPYHITTFKPFFIHVSFPSMIVQHEQIEIVVTIFNYLDKRLNVMVTFYNVDGICSEMVAPEKKVKKILTLDANSAERIAFPIVPINVGVFPIKLEARSLTSFVDIIIKNLTVRAPGIPKMQLISFDLDPTNRARRETYFQDEHIIDQTKPNEGYQRTDVMLKKEQTINNKKLMSLRVVPKTTYYVISALGERFKPKLLSIEELYSFIKKPIGCAEQNMHFMAVNLYTIMYLEQTQKLTYKIKIKAIEYLKKGYKSQISYRNDDGSFSPIARKPPSVWITAFSCKVLCQASPYIGKSLEKSVILDALKWLQKQQFPTDGSWGKENNIHHEEIIGGIKNRNALTAYILIAMNECKNYLNFSSSELNLDKSIHKAEKFVSSLVAKNNDFYTMAITAYSLTYNVKYKSTLQQIMSKLDDQALVEKNFMFWKSNFPVETAGYVLLTVCNGFRNDLQMYFNVSNFLTNKHSNPLLSTQDRVVSLEALSKSNYIFYKNLPNNQTHLITNISFNSRFKRAIRFDENNIDILRTIEVDNDTRTINFETTGNGLGRVEILKLFNVYNVNETCLFELEVDLKEIKQSEYSTVGNDFDSESFFSDDLKRDLTISIDKNSNKIPRNVCSFNVERKKRSLKSIATNFWKGLADKFKKSVPKNLKSTEKTSVDDYLIQSEQQFYQQVEPNLELPPLPNLGVTNPVVRLLNICTRTLKLDPKEINILEVSMLSGYKVIEQDLKFIQNSEDNFLYSYEIQQTKVVFYLKKLPYARRYCLKFRIFQQHQVKFVRSALVRIFDESNYGSLCTRFYSDVRITNYLDFNCVKEECHCMLKKHCPNNNLIETIVSKYKVDVKEAKDYFNKLLCKYSNSVIGVVIGKHYAMDDYKSSVFTIKPIKHIRGESFNSTFDVMLNSECGRNSVANGTEVLIMHKYNSNDYIYLLDGDSVFYSVHESLKNLVYILSFNKHC